MIAFALVALCGCGGGGTQKVLYAVGLDTPDVTIFAVSSSGALSSAASVSAGSTPNAIAIDPRGRFAYILDSGGSAGAVSQYVLNHRTGALTAATFSTTNGTAPAATPAETGANPKAMVIDSTGTFVFVANQGLSNPPAGSCDLSKSSTEACPSISVYCIDQVGGTLTEVKQLSPPPATFCTAIPPPVPNPLAAVTGAPTALATTGKMLFAATASAATGSVATYTFDSSGSLTPKPLGTPPTAALVGASPAAMTIDPSGKFLFVLDSVPNTNPMQSQVETFSIGSSGQLMAVGSGPVATGGLNSVSLHIDPSGKFLYTANQGSNDVSAFSIDSSGILRLVSGSPFGVAPGQSPSYVVTDSSGHLLFVANSRSNNISVFAVDSSGALKQVTGSPFGPIPITTPVALASIN